MICLCCGKQEKHNNKHRSRTGSVSSRRSSILYNIEETFGTDVDDFRQRNAHQVRMQMELTEELSCKTYGLVVNKNRGQAYEAEDFFLFKDILGTGATAVVFRAVFKPTGEELAIKFVPNYKSIKTMVLRELTVLKLTSRCSFLVQYHSHFRVGHNLYYVMEWCGGGSVEDLVNPCNTLPAKLMKIYLKEISSALFFLHYKKIVHRDVALPNLLIDAEGHLKLGDFGLCRMIEDPQGEILTDCGKHYVKAPEMYMDKPCTFAIDWWSVGVLTYRFITGTFPFNTTKLTMGYQTVTKLREKYPDWAFVDPDAKALCQGLLTKKPKERLASENEEFAIKSHPYFHGVDWYEREDIAGVVLKLQEITHDANGHVLLNRLFKIIQKPQPCATQPAAAAPQQSASMSVKRATTGREIVLLPTGDGLGSKVFIRLPETTV